MTAKGDTRRPGPSIAEIRALLEDRVQDVAQTYAPPAKGSYIRNGGWWTLNPGRADTNVGSFMVHLSGPFAGRFIDYTTSQKGDLIDLIQLKLACTPHEALNEARRYLGITEDTPQARKSRQDAIDEAARRRAAAEADTLARKTRRAKAARAIWLAASEALRDTPVDHYLRGRGIALDVLGAAPRAIRFAEAHRYYDLDPATGEIVDLEFPAMLTLVDVPGLGSALHQTWLSAGPNGWTKAPVRAPKKILGSYGGGRVSIWRGLRPDGTPAQALGKAPPDSSVYVTEGIEDALSVAFVAPHLRVLAALTLGNMGTITLPDTITEICLVADQDASPAARAALDRAIDLHRRAGRAVRVWRNRHGGKDFNDALRLWQAAQQKSNPEEQEP